MQREDAFRLGSCKTIFIDRLRKNDFEYNSYTSAVTCPGLKKPEIAYIVQEGAAGAYLIIPEDSGNDNEVKMAARKKLRNLASKF